MLHKTMLTAVLLAVSFLCSSCTGLSPVTGDLMQPPRLTAEQKAIDDALRESVTGDFTLKYPKSGDYRSAFIYQDLDKDGDEEALAFYSIGLSSTTRVALLDKEDGVWRAVNALSGASEEVEFVAFAHISGPDSADIVVGWSSEEETEKQLELYTCSGGKLERMLFRDSSGKTDFNYYDTYLINDLNTDGLDDIFLFSRDERNRLESSWIKQLCYDSEAGVVRLFSEHSLSDSISQFVGVIAGNLDRSSGRRGVFIDELLFGDVLATEVFTLDDDGLLAPVISIGMSGDESEDGGPPLYERTLRDAVSGGKDTPKETVCADINGDSVIEIPTARLLPGYQKQKDSEALYLTEYMQLQGNKLVRMLATVINRSGGYRVNFPEDWIDQVTVFAQPETSEWRFIEYNASLEDPFSDLAGELLRIRVVSKKGYQDKFLEKYTELDTRGMFTYYAYIPDKVKSSLSISSYQLSSKNPNRIFTLL